jgi:hypothetical protein
MHEDEYCKKCDSGESLDAEFTMFEITRALEVCGRTAPGEDRLCYTHNVLTFPYGSFGKSFSVLVNKIWSTVVLLSGWKRAVLLPFVKPGKDPSCPARYRPIALRSNLCK